MKGEGKTKKQLINGLHELRQLFNKLEVSVDEYEQVEITCVRAKLTLSWPSTLLVSEAGTGILREAQTLVLGF
jgi:hypothetical protein